MQLLLALTREILSQCVLDILFREEDMNTRERSIVWCHAIILQSGNRLHALLRHILLGQHDGQLLGTVVTEVDEDNHVTLLNQSIDSCIVNRFDELIRHTLVIALLHGSHHVAALLTLTLDEQVVSLLDTLPALVTVHGIETTHNAGDGSVILGTYLADLLDEALTALGVRVTTIHETVYECLVLQTIVLTHLDEFEEMVQRRVNTTVRGQTHQVQFLIILLGISIGSLHLCVLHDRAVLAGTVDLHEVLIDNTSRTNIEVTHLRVTHLSVGKTHVLTGSLQL